jgi:hypothetical protein
MTAAARQAPGPSPHPSLRPPAVASPTLRTASPSFHDRERFGTNSAQNRSRSWSGGRAGGGAGKDYVNPQAGRDAAAALWRQAGITDPLNEIDVAEIYVPFS